MTKEFSVSTSNSQPADTLVKDTPELKLDHDKIDTLIEPEARVKAYHELFTKYLEAIEKEPSINKQRYYGHYLENLMDQITNDNLTINAKESKKELLSQIATFTENLKEAGQGIYITTRARSAIKAGQPCSFKEATAQCVTEQVSAHIKYKLVPWANEHGNIELSRELSQQEEKLWVKKGKGEKEKQYKEKGKKFWEKCLSFIEKLFPPKPIAFNVGKEAKKYEDQFKNEKTSYITSALDFIKGRVNQNKSGEILKSQIESLMPPDRSISIIETLQQQQVVSASTAIPFNKLAHATRTITSSHSQR
jgi:hypothetical protein